MDFALVSTSNAMQFAEGVFSSVILSAGDFWHFTSQNPLPVLLLLCTGIHAKGASEKLLCQRDGLARFERELVQRYICGPKEM